MDLMPVLIAMIAGILLADASFIAPAWAYACCGVLFLCSGVFVKSRLLWIIIAAFTAFIAVVGLYHHKTSGHDVCADEIISYAGGRKVFISGWIVEPVIGYADRDKIVLKIDTIDNDMNAVSGCRIQITIFYKDGGFMRFVRGDYITIHVLPREPKNYKNPGSFDYINALRRKNVGLIAYINNKDDLSVRSDKAKRGVLRTIDGVRLQLKDIIRNHVTDRTALGIVTALVIGDQGYIGQDVRKMFASTGIVHILVVAGLHLAIITHLFYLLIKFLLSRSKYLCLHTSIPKLSLLLSMVPMTAYIFISGANPPVIRSGIMIAVYGIMFLMNRTQARWAGILVSAFFILMLDPTALYSISFQLSFIAVGSIIAFAPAITRILSALNIGKGNHIGRIVKYITGMFLVSFFVTIGLGGVTAFYFNTLPLFGILLNVIVIPVFCYLILPLSLISSAAGFVMPVISHYIFVIVVLFIHIIVNVIHAISGLSAASVKVPAPSLFELFLYYSAIIVMLNAKRIGPKTALTALSMLSLLILSDAGYYAYRTRWNRDMSVTFIDVGQGDSAFIELPYGKTLLIDAGGGAYRSYDTGESVVARYIWSLKRTHVDYVIASHPQIDHIGGLGFIIMNMNVREVYKNDCSPDTDVYTKFINAANRSRTAVYTITGQTVLKDINGAKVELFSVPHEVCDSSSNKDINNTVLLSKITYGDVSVLFTGDIEKDAEQVLSYTYQSRLKADIMKAAHHGSRTSNSEQFLSTVKPEIVVVPAGEGNPFHLPSKVVLKRFFEKDIQVLRTDRSGAIRITTDGKHIKIKRYREP